MLFDFVVSAVFIVTFLAFWYLQIFTRTLSTRYYLQVTLLGVVSLSSGCLALRLLAFEQSWTMFIAVIGMAAVFIYHTGLFFIKFVMETDTRYRWIHKANRAIVSYDLPHERFTLHTDDGVRLQAIALCRAATRNAKAVVICHGAGRNKNTLPIVQTAQILATIYDVFTFDFRGHMESGGVFQADGDTELDLKAMLDYLVQAGYKKIAVIGWSIGAWTGLLSASRGRPIDALIAGAPPPANMASLFYIRSLTQFRLLQAPLLAGVAVVRNMWVKEGKHILTADEFARDIPAIPILLIYNEYDNTLKTRPEDFDKLAAALPAGTEKVVLPGTGHMFDWPNTYFLWNKMIDWLSHNF